MLYSCCLYSERFAVLGRESFFIRIHTYTQLHIHGKKNGSFVSFSRISCVTHMIIVSFVIGVFQNNLMQKKLRQLTWPRKKEKSIYFLIAVSKRNIVMHYESEIEKNLSRHYTLVKLLRRDSRKQKTVAT